jgi:hypothetical protein
MARARPKPDQIALPPSPTKEGGSSTPPPSPPHLSIDLAEPSPLSPDYILPPGPNSPVSPTTPITPAILGDWPKDKWDAMGLASPMRSEFVLNEKETKVRLDPFSILPSASVLRANFTILEGEEERVPPYHQKIDHL